MQHNYVHVGEDEAIRLVNTGKWRIISVDGPLNAQRFLLESVCDDCGG